MMGAPVGRDKDAVFKHKRVAETKGSTCVAVKGMFASGEWSGRQPAHAPGFATTFERRCQSPVMSG